MGKTLTIPDEVYQQLERLAEAQGADNVEALLARLWQDELHRRRELGRRIDALRERLFDKYGNLGGSTEMICQDRER